MSWWQYLLAIVGILCSILNSSLQFVDDDSFGTSLVGVWWAHGLKAERLWLTVVFAAITGVIAFGVVFFMPRKAQKAFRESLMDGIYETILDNDKNTGRITLFKDVGFLGTQWRRFKDFVGLLRRGWRLRKVIAYCWEANYIKIMSRWGNEYKNSKTYFCVNRSTASKCQGVAGQVRQREEMVVVELPSLDGIDLKAVDEHHPVVQEYMRRGHVNDIDVLRSIHKPAPFIYGNFISARGGRKKLVLVIDSWAYKSPFLTKQRKHILARYAKQISASFGA